MINDSATNTEFKYLYCHDFKWLDPRDNEQSGGHPKPKQIYRAWFNTDTKTYRLVTAPGHATFLTVLKSDDNFLNGFVGHLEEVTISNILNFKDVSEENLSNLLQWMEIDNMDLKERLGFVGKPTQQLPTPADIVAIIQSIPTKAQQQEITEIASLQGFLESGEELLSLNPTAFEVIWNLIDHILDEMYKQEDGPLDKDWLSMDSTRAGLGHNISKACDNIYKYSSTNRKTNENPDDLFQAMSHLTTELSRRLYNNLDQ